MNLVFRIQNEESGVWEAPQCADSGQTHDCTKRARFYRSPLRIIRAASLAK